MPDQELAIAEQEAEHRPRHKSAHVRPAPTPPATPNVQVEALTTIWLMNGAPVVAGVRYAVPPNEAARLEFVGKARRVT
jgi:hypothetical protein